VARNVLSRYLDPEVLSQVADRHFDPRGLVVGNLAGAHQSPLSGFAVEFAGHREYSPGDDPKHIDWRVYFNRDKLFVKQYALETNFVCHLLLDISASMRYGDGATAEADVRVSHGGNTRLFDRASKRQSQSGHLRFAGAQPAAAQQLAGPDRADDPAPGRNPAGPKDLDGRLPDGIIDPHGAPRNRRGLQRFLHRPGPLEAALHRLRYNRHEVVLFQVLHHDELSFEFDTMTKFIGLEIAEELLVQPEDLRRGYLNALERVNRQLEEIAERRPLNATPDRLTCWSIPAVRWRDPAGSAGGSPTTSIAATGNIAAAYHQTKSEARPR
jgi:hypothetical protein